MMATLNVETAVNGAMRDMHYLGECKRLLASPGLVQALLELFKERALDIGSPEPDLTGTLYFRGNPVVECDLLEDLEYAFVK